MEYEKQSNLDINQHVNGLTIMEELIEILQKINIPTYKLSSEIIQDVLLKARKNRCSETHWNEVSEILWLHLLTGLNKFDDQLLCATCFYTVLPLTDKQEFYSNKVLKTINNELVSRDADNKESTKTLHAVSLMYGIFQSAFLTQNNTRDISNLGPLLQSIFKLLLIMAYEYSRFTFIVFKIINSFKKVIGTPLQEFIFNKCNKVKLINLINHNWENPITGVRDLNKDIFQTLISVLNEQMYDMLFEEINGFYWNKAKYLMLAEIVKQSNKNITYLMANYKWLDGLLYSLDKPGLVSAGADMYFAIFKKLKSEDEWCSIFLQDVVEILSGTSVREIENFNNYWCLTTFKRFPSLFEVFMEELKKLNGTEQKLYSSLCITMQANKLSLVTKTWTSTDDVNGVEKLVLKGLEHCKSPIRMLAFDILCISRDKSMPTEIEYELVLIFLHNNINSDCTVLRLGMLNSFTNFLIQTHISFLNIKNMQDGDKQNLQEFCTKFQAFVINSMEMDGNYQRKVTCIKLTKIFLSSLNEVPRKRQMQTRKSNTTLIEMLKEKVECVLFKETFIMKLLKLFEDPAVDIRENVIELLQQHYFSQLRNKQLIDYLIESALVNMRSKFFYHISCGQSMFKLIVNILVKENPQDWKFKSVEDIFQFAFNELISEYRLKTHIVESIENGKQLHSYMNILLVILEVCFQNSYKIKVSNDSILELLELLDGVSNQFAGEQESSTSSDFSKISDMVENIILVSGYNSTVENDQTKISGMHQIVLNCLWLNVKASCDLSSLLVQFQDADNQTEICEKSLHVITHVLETCRHKGAIEAAGVALGQSIRHLTLLPEESDVSRVPFSLLKNKLDELISEASRMASVTRRGAGLSIMVHRIVSNDMKKGKPLFHYFMNTILKACSNAEDIPNTLEIGNNTDNEKDLPKAIYIHFLTRIVTDSSLASDMMYYSAKLAELAFDNLTSPHWQIRNAALQLYGALIPKLIGQKKASGTHDETIATVACDELRTHSPKLWQYIQSQLKNNYFKDKVQYHSNLIPILNILANIARRYNLSFDMKEQDDAELLKSLVLLLDSPIYTVRRLTARCIFNIYSFGVIYDTIVSQDLDSENFLHGCILLISNCYKFYYHDNLCQEYFNNLKLKFSQILNDNEHSYLCNEVFEDMFLNYDLDVNKFKETLMEVNSHLHAPGIFLWASTRIQKIVKNMSWDMTPQTLKLILDCKEYEHYCKYFLQKIENDTNIPREILLQDADILMSFKEKFKSSIIWKILYQISLKTELHNYVEITDVLVYLKDNVASYKLRYAIPFIAKISASNGNENSLIHISNIIYAFSDSEIDVEMRYIAAIANNELATTFSSLPDSVKVTAIKSAVILLQDEDEDVRSASVHFHRNINNAPDALHPYVCLFRILDYTNLHICLNNSGIQCLYDDLAELVVKFSNSHNVDEYNPFTNDSKNIYLEVKVFRRLIENLKNN